MAPLIYANFYIYDTHVWEQLTVYRAPNLALFTPLLLPFSLVLPLLQKYFPHFLLLFSLLFTQQLNSPSLPPPLPSTCVTHMVGFSENNLPNFNIICKPIRVEYLVNIALLLVGLPRVLRGCVRFFIQEFHASTFTCSHSCQN